MAQTFKNENLIGALLKVATVLCCINLIFIQISYGQSVQNHINDSSTALSKPTKTLGSFSKQYKNQTKTWNNYIPAGSFAKAVIVTGFVVATDSNSQSNSETVFIHLTDGAIFDKKKRLEQIKDAKLTANCSWDRSSERVHCQLQKLIFEDLSGDIIERSIKGWVYDENNVKGIKGIVGTGKNYLITIDPGYKVNIIFAEGVNLSKDKKK